TRATLPPGSSLAGEEWLAIAEATRAGGRSAAETGAIVRAGAPITEGDARAAAASLLRHTATVSLEQGRLTAREGARLGAIELTSTPVPVSVEGARAALASALERDGLAVLELSREAEQLRRRLAFCRHHLGDPWPAVDAAGLADALAGWLGPWLPRLAGGLALRRLDAVTALRNLLPWPEATRFTEFAPERLRVPSGSRIRIDYPDDTLDPDARPVVAVKL